MSRQRCGGSPRSGNRTSISRGQSRQWKPICRLGQSRQRPSQESKPHRSAAVAAARSSTAVAQRRFWVASGGSIAALGMTVSARSRQSPRGCCTGNDAPIETLKPEAAAGAHPRPVSNVSNTGNRSSPVRLPARGRDPRRRFLRASDWSFARAQYQGGRRCA